MNSSSAPVVNHHADHPGFAGLAGTLVGSFMLIAGSGRARLAVELAAVTETDRVVDIGCGPGNAVRAAARRGAEVTGVDPSPVMLRLARTFTRRQPMVTWSDGAAEDLPVPDGCATVVWSIATVHHWRDVTTGLAEVRRVLGSGGRFLAIELQHGRRRPAHPQAACRLGRARRPAVGALCELGLLARGATISIWSFCQRKSGPARQISFHLQRNGVC